MQRMETLCTGLLLGYGLSAAVEAAETQPNFFLIMADDATARDLELHGGQAYTPHINQLASEGMMFTQCFQAAPTCAPTRHNLFTGIYPVRTGTDPNHAIAYDWVRSIATYFNEAGYRSYMSGKWHLAPDENYPFERSEREDGNPDPQAWAEALRHTRETGQPFLYIATSREPHTPWNKGDPSVYPPDELELPPVFVDTDNTRVLYSRYLAEITYFDGQVGEHLALLDESGLADNTVVLMLTEQGSSFPYAKWTLYDAGLQSAAVVRWPGRVEPGSVSDALIEYVDVTPTFLDAAGLPIPDDLDGRSFLPVLKGETDTHKDVVFGIQTTRGVNYGSKHYGIRSARSADYLYIRNLTPEVAFACAATRGRPWPSWVEAAEAGDAHAQRLVHEFQYRPAEELYDVRHDPWHRTNLIDRTELAPVRDDLRARLDAWMAQQGDEGQATEMRALDRTSDARARNWRPGGHPWRNRD